MIKVLLVILVLVGAVVGLCLFSGKKKEEPAAEIDEFQETEEATNVSQEEEDINKIYNSLLDLNIRLRTKHGFTPVMLHTLEMVIDRLVYIVPKMKEKWPDSDLTWETSRIVTKHIPNFLDKYLCLNPEQLKKKESQFLDSLRIIDIEIDEVIALYEANAENEASTRARIIRRKFEQAPSEGKEI